jgi:nicotinamide-nucleotide amidase
MLRFMLTAEIIATGSEMLTPARTDTNSLWLTEKLNAIGIEVKRKTIVGDDLERMEQALRDALGRAGLVITTGGLGPTEDDVTRGAISAATGRGMSLDEALVEEIRARFASFGRAMPEINRRQAYVIENSQVLPNPNGSAPGLFLAHEGTLIAALPGPPREMEPMFERFVLPHLRERAGGVCVARRVMRVVGMGESAVDELIAPVYTQYQNPQTTILFNRAEIEIHLTAQADDEDAANALLNELADKIAAPLGPALFSRHGETMEEVVAHLLTAQSRTLALAESCTGGLIAERLTEIPGSSVFFMEGVVAYANEAKTRALNVPAELIAAHGAVSGQVAEAMAVGVKERAGTDFGVSVTGIAGPGGGTPEKPVGLVYIGLADAGGVTHRRLQFPGDRHLVRWRASQGALELLRRRLL